MARIHIAPTFVTPLLKAISENAFRQEDAIQIKTESTPTRVTRDPSTPQSTRPDEEANRVWPHPERIVGLGWTMEVSVPPSPPEEAVLDVVITFGGDVVRMEAVDIGVSAEGREAPSVYVRLIDAVSEYLEASKGDRAKLLNYAPDTWFRFVPPRERHKTLTERFNEAYDEEARREDEEFFRTTERYYRRRFNAED